MELYGEGANALAASVYSYLPSFFLVSQGALHLDEGLLEEVPCCYAFSRWDDGAGVVNGSEEGIDGERFA